MNIIMKQGDLFETEIKLIVHGCNDRGVMGSGVAAIIREKYPEAYNGYVEYHEKHGLKGADCILIPSNGKLIVNMVTQNFFGRDGKRYAKYDWIADGFYTLNSYCKRGNIKQVAMPMIGAGLGGGDWNVIKSIIESECTDVQPVVYYL